MILRLSEKRDLQYCPVCLSDDRYVPHDEDCPFKGLEAMGEDPSGDNADAFSTRGIS